MPNHLLTAGGASKGLGKVCLGVLLSLFLVTLFEVWFYFYYVTGVERDVTTTEIQDAANVMGLQLQSALNGGTTKGTEPMTEAQRETALLRVDAYLDAFTRALAPTLESEKENVQSHNKSVRMHGFIMCAGVALLLIVCVVCVAQSAKKSKAVGQSGQLLGKHILTEIFLVLFGFIVYDFVFFHFIVRKYKPLSGGGFLQRAFTNVAQNSFCLPAPSNNAAEVLLRDARAMQAAIDAGSERDYLAALTQTIQTLQRQGGATPELEPPRAPPSTPTIPLDLSQCQQLAEKAMVVAHQRTYGQDPLTQDLLKKMSACAQR